MLQLKCELANCVVTFERRPLWLQVDFHNDPPRTLDTQACQISTQSAYAHAVRVTNKSTDVHGPVSRGGGG